jgi:hypothetical protein
LHHRIPAFQQRFSAAYCFSLGLGVLSLAFLVWQLGWERREMWHRWQGLEQAPRLELLAAAVLLWPFNWGLEAFKWRYLMRRAWPIDFLRAFRYTLAGTALALWTPGRVGQGAGWLWFIPASLRWEGVRAGMLGAFAQNAVTFLVGLLGLAYYLEAIEALSPPTSSQAPSFDAGEAIFWGAMFVLLAGSAGVWLRHRGSSRKLWRGGLRRLRRLVPQAPLRDGSMAFLLAGTRFLVYSSQYAFVAMGLGFDMGWPELVARIALMFSIQALLPTLALFDLGLRASLTILVFSSVDETQLPLILLAGGFIWLLNLVIPALAGVWVWLRPAQSTRAPNLLSP